MKNPITLFWLTVLGLFPTFLFSQQALKLKLQLLPDGETWGVYVKPDDSISPSNFTITGTAQVTVVMPKDYAWTGLQSVSGTWMSNASYHGPVENPTRSYISFGLLHDLPQIKYVAGQETLLFKFKRTTACPDSIYLINNATDPFNQLPNSVYSNPGNELSVFDPNGAQLYQYAQNYAPSAWSCHDNDGDGILNAFEDSNGNGVYDLGVDASDLNTPDFTSSAGGIKLKLQLMPDGNSWGVYAKPEDGFSPSANTITGTAQVTVVMPKNYGWFALQSVSGNWAVSSVLNGPQANPYKSYISFGLQNDLPHIKYVAGQETLLFTFKKAGCPVNISLVDCGLDPLCNSPIGNNVSNDLSVIDMGNPGFPLYFYTGNYAPAAWDCHDNDGDGVLNAHEDTNGNGVYDPGVDASDLNAPNPDLGTGCVKLKLQLLPDSSGWAVMAKPFGGYMPSGNAVATSGRVTIVAPVNMPLNGLQFINGQWLLSSTLYPYANPNLKYWTFKLSANATNLTLSATGETTLFKFNKLGDCPDFLYLMETNVPTGLEPNDLSGSDPNSFTSSGFEYCGVYARKAWRCARRHRPRRHHHHRHWPGQP